MAKFYGRIGFGTEVETEPGVWEQSIVERPYYGEIIRETLEVVGGQTILGDSKTNNSFRVVADRYADYNFMDMIYVKWRDRYWAVRQVEVQSRPRMLIRIGGVYNGPVYEDAPIPEEP